MLNFEEFSLFLNGKSIVNGVSAFFSAGELVVITGDNGSGKSTFASGIMGISAYRPFGKVYYKNQNITDWSIEKRAQAGIFLAYQYPLEIPGLSLITLLQHAHRACYGNTLTLQEITAEILTACSWVGLPSDLLQRDLSGFSGGQKKRLELVQMLVLKPKVIIFDEIDSGLDAPGIAMVLETISQYRADAPETLFLIITHNEHFAHQCKPDKLLTMQAGTLHV